MLILRIILPKLLYFSQNWHTIQLKNSLTLILYLLFGIYKGFDYWARQPVVFLCTFFPDRATCNLIGRILMYITTICATIFTKYAEITICRQKIVAILFYFFYNRSIRSIKRLNHKNSLYEFYILAFFSSRELLRIFSSIFFLVVKCSKDDIFTI